MPWLLLVCFLPTIVYGFVNVFSPRRRWLGRYGRQRDEDREIHRRRVGKAFHRRVGFDPAEPPSADALRKIRFLGVGEIAFCVLIIVGAFALS